MHYISYVQIVLLKQKHSWSWQPLRCYMYHCIRTNWPNYLRPDLHPSAIYMYCDSGIICSSLLILVEIPVIFFLYIYHIKCDISIFPKKNIYCVPMVKHLSYYWLSVKLSSFHISFRWDRPRASQEKSWCTLISWFSRGPHWMGTEF